LLYALVAILSAGIDLGFFTLFTTVGPSDMLYKILVATIGARLLSGAFNFTLEYYLVFENQGGFAKKLARYLIIFFINMGLSFALTYAFDYLPGNLTFIKLIVDFILFVLNYFVARGWVFAKKLVRHDVKKKDLKVPEVSK
jgi:hypothetical protein